MINRYNNQTHRDPPRKNWKSKFTKRGKNNPKIIQRKNILQRRKTNRSKYRKNAYYAIKENNIKLINKGKKPNKITLKLLDTVSLEQEEYSKELIESFNDIYCHTGGKKNTIVTLDFNSVREIEVSGAIYIYGLIQYLAYNNVKLKYRIKNNVEHNQLEQMLCHLGVAKYEATVTDPDLRKWYIIPYSKEIDSEHVTTTLEKIKELPNEKKEIAYDAILETLQNCSRHAYRKDEEKDFRNYYTFIKVIVDEEKTILAICTFDHGQGFRESYLNNPNVSKEHKETIWEWMRDHSLWAEKKLPEGELIKKIITEGKSGTKEFERGNGLSSLMKDVLDSNMELGEIQVYSRQGFFKKNSHEEMKTDNRKELQGTLVQVTITI